MIGGRGIAAVAALIAFAGCQDIDRKSPHGDRLPVLALNFVQPALQPDSTEPESSQNNAVVELATVGTRQQGGWIRGRFTKPVRSAQLGGVELVLDDDGRFFAGFDRDAPAEMMLVAIRSDGSEYRTSIRLAPRAWKIEHVDVARRPSGSSEVWWKKREPEWKAIVAARANDTGAQGWRQQFIWPVKGRVSGRFGSQRIYRGEPGSYHSGMDISTGEAGTPYVAPADGVVVLAADDFSLEGKLLIIDHGQGLNSAFLHSSRLLVREGDVVRQGQHIGDIGASGRATGPHLHWSIKWRDARLDPLLFVEPGGEAITIPVIPDQD